ncbi:MAG: NfeD family protein [Phycisphaeraceae bacterium]
MTTRPLQLLALTLLLAASLLAQTTPAPTPRLATASAIPSIIPPGGKIALLRIEGVIQSTLEELLQRRVDRAIAQGASVIVIELDTPGGELPAALRLSRLIKAIPVPTVAWVNPDAYSAGALLASAADEIVMATSASIGDAAPINLFSSNLGPTERAKALSPLLSEFKDNATRNGYDYAPLHAMCVLGVEVYYIENPATGQRRLVNQVDYQLMVHGSPTLASQISQGISSVTGAGSVGQPTQDVATTADLGQWLPVDVLPSGDTIPDGRVHDGKSLLTIKDIRARDLRISRATIDTTTQLISDLQAADLIEVRNTWAESAALFLAQWWVRGILVALFLIGVFLELSAPGLSLPGAVAILALTGLFGAPLILGLASIWHIVLFVIGLLLLITDLLFLIGFGFLGAAGLSLMVIALIVSVLPSGSTPLGASDPAYWSQLGYAIASLLLATGITAAFAVALPHVFTRIPLLNALILADPEPADPSTDHISGEEVLGIGHLNVGDTGTVASSVMRPSGEILINNQRIDAITNGEYLTQHQPIRITEIHGSRIVVEPIDPPTT